MGGRKGRGSLTSVGLSLRLAGVADPLANVTAVVRIPHPLRRVAGAIVAVVVVVVAVAVVAGIVVIVVVVVVRRSQGRAEAEAEHAGGESVAAVVAEATSETAP